MLKWIGLALALSLGSAHAQPVIPLTQASVPIAVTTNTTTQLVALKSGQSILVTAVAVISSGTGDIQFVAGTGTNCATGQTTLTGNIPLTAQVGFAPGSGIGVILVVPKSQALCIVTDQSVNMEGWLAYAQF